MRLKSFKSLLAFLALIIVIQLLGSLATSSGIDSWYPLLNKPYWNPPGWIFGPVWTVLYLMIAVVGWRIWNRVEGKAVSQKMIAPALRWYFIQLFLNAIWSPLFFGLQSPLLGLIDIVLVLAAITVCIWHFARLDRVSMLLFLPYFTWVAFAATVNAGIVALNWV